MSCEQCLRESRINPQLTSPPLQNPTDYITAPENAMQIVLVPELPPSEGFENIVIATDVFPFFFLHTRHQIKTPEKLLNL